MSATANGVRFGSAAKKSSIGFDTAGWMMASRSRRARLSLKTICADPHPIHASRRDAPHPGRIACERHSAPAMPGVTTSRASTSASTIGTPASRKRLARNSCRSRCRPSAQSSGSHRRLSRRSSSAAVTRVSQHHRDRQRTDAARHRRNRAGDRFDLGMHIANQDRCPCRRTPRACGCPRRKIRSTSACVVSVLMPTSIDRGARLDEFGASRSPAGRSPRRECPRSAQPPANRPSANGRS